MCVVCVGGCECACVVWCGVCVVWLLCFVFVGVCEYCVFVWCVACDVCRILCVVCLCVYGVLWCVWLCEALRVVFCVVV